MIVISKYRIEEDDVGNFTYTPMKLYLVRYAGVYLKVSAPENVRLLKVTEIRKH